MNKHSIMVTLEKYYKLTAQQEYEKNPKLSLADVKELISWSDKSIKLHGRLSGECNTILIYLN